MRFQVEHEISLAVFGLSLADYTLPEGIIVFLWHMQRI